MVVLQKPVSDRQIIEDEARLAMRRLLSENRRIPLSTIDQGESLFILCKRHHVCQISFWYRDTFVRVFNWAGAVLESRQVALNGKRLHETTPVSA